MSKIIIDLRLLDEVNRTGMGNYIFHLVQELVKLDRELYYFVGDFVDETLFSAEHHFNIGLPHSDIPFSNQLLALDGFIRNYDLLYSPYYPIPERRTFKGVLNLMDLIPLRYPELFMSNSLYDVHIRKCVQSIDHIVAISEATKLDAIHFYQLDPEKITVIYPGINPVFLNASEHAEEDAKILESYQIKEPYILSVCTLEPRKNLARTLEAYTIVRQNSADRMQLVLVGGLGWKYESLLQQIESHPFREDIVLTGFVPDGNLPVFYRHAKVFVYASLYEGFGLPVLEAMACGVPVVTSNVSSLPEAGGHAAIYSDPYDSQSIAEGIEQVINNQKRRMDLIASGLKHAQNFSYKKAALQLHEIFRKVIN
jgi:glycosyltransferase involved in cell wall biosynthesis